MKIAAVTAAALLMAAGAQGKSGTGRQVTVFMDNGNLVPFFVRLQAERLASIMFAEIGVTLNFRTATPEASETEVIVIEFRDGTPAGLLPGAWANARAYEGVHIRIFWDRLQFRCSQQLLAHVMVHEITHILQGVSRHSAEGIMNARWTVQERSALERRPLQFTDEDVELIYRGIDAREACGRSPVGQTSARISLKAASTFAVQ
jgi:hypothetical protein